MSNPGYVYVLINPSLPDCVKIGKTTRDVSQRAAEISSATGVPTPFIVAYETFFENCDLAESWIHTRLESKGVRLSNNREFFSISPTLAITTINEAKSALNADTQETEDVLWDADGSLYSAPWHDALHEANAYYYGDDETVPDIRRAIELYKRAAKLGAADAYLKLADLVASEGGPVNAPQQGIDWLNQGAERGINDCILALAEIYGGRNIFFPAKLHNRENEIRCYRRYFKICNITTFNTRVVYVHIKHYLAAVKGSPEDVDREIAARVVRDFRIRLKKDKEHAEIDQVNALLHLHRWVQVGSES